MGLNNTSVKKVKVTASLDPDLVKTIDGCLKKSKIRSRSQFIEDILRAWQIQQNKISLESEIEHYYLSLSEKELQEDHEWTDMAAKSAFKIWEE